MAERKALNDVYVIRPIAIFLLVVWHSFIMYTGGWKEHVGFQPIEGYWWLAKLSYAFMLELFVFVSSYVLGLTLERKTPSFKSLIVSKFRCLIIPSLVFSVIYYFLFYNIDEFTVGGFIWNILNGCGHMWFLPMLFWATLIAFVLDNIRKPQWLKFVVVYCLPALSLLPIPLGLASAMYYLPFFYTGLVIYRWRDKILGYVRNRLSMNVLLGGVFVALFIVVTIIGRDILSLYTDSNSLVIKGIAFLCKKYLQLLCAASGVAFVYVLVNYLIEGKGVTISQRVVKLNG